MISEQEHHALKSGDRIAVKISALQAAFVSDNCAQIKSNTLVVPVLSLSGTGKSIVIYMAAGAHEYGWVVTKGDIDGFTIAPEFPRPIVGVRAGWGVLREDVVSIVSRDNVVATSQKPEPPVIKEDISKFGRWLSNIDQHNKENPEDCAMRWL